MNNKEVLGGFSVLLYPVTLILFPIIAIVSSFFYYKKYRQNYFYDISGEHLTVKKGVFSSHETHILLSSVYDVTLDQDLIDKVLGIYDVHFITENGGGGDALHIDGMSLAGATKIKELLLGKVSRETISSEESTPSNLPHAGASHLYKVSFLWLIKQSLRGLLFSCIPVLIVWLGLFWPAKVKTPTLLEIFEPSFSQINLLSFTYALSLGVFMLFSLWKKLFTSYLFKKDYLETHFTSLLGSKEKHMLYSSIKKANLTQSMLDTVLGLADIELSQNDSSKEELGEIPVTKALTLFGMSENNAKVILHNLEKKSVRITVKK